MTELIDSQELEIPDPKDGWKRIGIYNDRVYSWRKYQGPNQPIIVISYDGEHKPHYLVYDDSNKRSLKAHGWVSGIGMSEWFYSLNNVYRALDKYKE